uniref:Transposase (Putative), gypsy type n=1 Tax=Tanacetum cinerariifolium TaxID=118510 RepID=A0A699J5X0_TANCI|nr:hypothetical protein [Tanacetum cinerariifolium]
MDLFAFIQVVDPTKVKAGERECVEEEAKLLDFTVRSVVPILPVTPACSENELEASVKRLFDEGGSADQVDFAADGGQEVETRIATWVRVVFEGNAGGYGASSEAAICGKSPSALRELLVSSLLNVEVGVAALPTLPMTTSLVSATPEHESDSSRHSSTHAFEAEGDSIIRSAIVPLVITEAVVTSYSVNVPSVLKMGAKIRKMDYHHLFTEFNVGTARQASLNAKVRMRTKYCLNERKRLESGREKQDDLLKVSASKAAEKMHVGEIDALKQKNVALKNEKESLDVKVAELISLVSSKDLEPKELNVVVSSLMFQKDGLVGQVHELEATCFGLRVQEYLSALGATISRAIEKGMQDGLSAGIDHGKAGRSLADVVAYNPLAKADYTYALQRLREVDFPLLSELKSHKDASTVDVMDLLCLEDQVIIRETSLLDSLYVTHSRVERIRENVAAQRSTLIGVWTPLVNLLFVENLVGAASTSDSMPVTAATTTAVSVTFALASTVPPITIEDYEIMGTDGLEEASREKLSFS